MGRLLLQHVQGRAGDAALPEGVRHRGLVHGPAAGGVDEVGGGLHRGELGGPEHRPGVRVQEGVHRDEVGAPAERVERDQFDAPRAHGLGREVRVVGEVPHPETGHFLGS